MAATQLGANVSAYLNRRRVEYAADALLKRSDPITTIMYDSGFGSKSAFQREFRKRFSMSPSEYRRQFQKERLNAQPKADFRGRL
jgi:AraC-like DNA-binding protein